MSPSLYDVLNLISVVFCDIYRLSIIYNNKPRYNYDGVYYYSIF